MVGLFGAPAAVPSQRGFGRHIEARQITVLSINLLGDGLRDALDPRLRY